MNKGEVMSRLLFIMLTVSVLSVPKLTAWAQGQLPGIAEKAPATSSSGSTTRSPQRKNCGTVWTGWIDDPDSDVNPCPQGCERGERQIVKTYQVGDTTQYDVRYQCYQAASAVTAGKLMTDRTPGVLKRPAAIPVGTLTPTSGPWHTFVHISGDRMGDVIGVRTVWYPNDDDSQAPLGSISTTLRGADPKTGAEIEIPADAGGPQGGVVRIMITLRGEKEPLFAGRFTVDNNQASNGQRPSDGQIGLATAGAAASVAAVQDAAKTSQVITEDVLKKTQPKIVITTTEPLQLTGKWPSSSASRTLLTEPLQMTGRWPANRAVTVIATDSLRMTGHWPLSSASRTLLTEPLQMTGRWPANRAVTVIATDSLRMTGRWPSVLAPRTLLTLPLQMTGRWPANRSPAFITTDSLRMTGRWPANASKTLPMSERIPQGMRR